MSSEIEKILQTIENQPNSPSAGSFLAETRSEKWLGGLAIVFLILCVVLFVFDSASTYALIAGLFFLLTMIGFTVVQTFSVVKWFRRPLAGFAEQARNRLESRNFFISALAAFSSESLHVVKLAIERDTGRMQQRIEILVGSLAKVGFIPAGLALYFAAIQSSTEAQIPSIILMAFVFGLYLGAFWVQRVIDILRFNGLCINEAYELSLSREMHEKSSDEMQRKDSSLAV